VDAFRATLEETLYADLLLHVADASSPERSAQEEVVAAVLKQLGAADKPILTVYNKTDLLEEPVGEKNGVAVSAVTGAGIPSLKDAVLRKLAQARLPVSVLLPAGSGALISRVYANGQVIECDYREDGIRVTAVVAGEDAERLRAAAITIYR
jgi:GTP-binding protein HflX